MRHLSRLVSILLVVSVLLSFGTVFAGALEEDPTDILVAEVSSEDTLETEAVPETEGEPEVEAEPETEGESGIEAEPETEAKPEVEEKTETEAEPGVEVEPETEAEPEEEAVPEAAEEPTDEPEPTTEPEERGWIEPGNTDAEITGGGRYLPAENGLYYSDGGIWLDTDSGTRYLSGDDARNLNLSDGRLYFTVGGSVRRIPADGGAAETVYDFGTVIKQLYVMGAELRFLADGCAYSYDMQTGELSALEAPENAATLIPTPAGNVYLTGEPFCYTVWAGTERLCGNAEQCSRDGDWLVLVTGGETVQASIADAFAGAFSVQPYRLHEDMLYENGLSDERQLENEAAYLQSEAYAMMQDGLTVQTDGAYTSVNKNIASTAYTDGSLTADQKNMVLRARQMAEVKWTPLSRVYSWGGDDSNYVSNNTGWGSKVTATDGTVTYGYFAAGKTYQGVPYSQAVYTGFVGWTASIETFVEAVNDSSSKFYTEYSHYSRTAPYYGTDCSAFVSWAWDLSTRCTCTSMLRYSSYIGKSLSSLRIGDSLNNPNSHVVLITDIGYDADGNVVAVEITEETPCKMRVTCYGELIPGKTYQYTGALSYIERNYFNGGYSIYRRAAGGNVSFRESTAVELKESGYAAAPGIKVSLNKEKTAKVVSLTHDYPFASIYYTTDGSAPTTSSKRYTGSFSVTKDTTIRAVADLGAPYVGGFELKYVVSVKQAEAPHAEVVSGDIQGSFVSSGTMIKLVNGSGDKVYYTTDGTQPTENSAVMPAGGIKVTKAMTLKAFAANDDDLHSNTVTLLLNIGDFSRVKATASTGGTITPAGDTGVLKGRDQTYTIVPNDRYEIADVKVDGVSVGCVKQYTFKNVKEDHTISATFSVVLPFSDVKGGWYAENVAFVYIHDLFSGTTATSFSPDTRMTRGMFITVLGRFAGGGKWTELENWNGCLGMNAVQYVNIRQQTNTSDSSVILGYTNEVGQRLHVLSVVPTGLDGATWYKVSTGSVTGYMRATANSADSERLLNIYDGSFTDLPAGAYYTGYAQWAYINGLAKGVSDSKFAPNQYIRRQDICVILYKYLTSYLGMSVSSSAGTFTDDANIASYARTAVYAMKNIGVVNGYTDGSFRPNGYATRAEVAKMFQNLYEYLNG